MTVLVAAASKHGATDEIAERIGADLAERGLDVDVKKLEKVGDLGGYEAFVLGSGIYLGKWLKEARSFVDAHAGELVERPTWLFASGSIVGDPPVADDPNAVRAALVETLVETTHAREPKLFAGKLDKEQARLDGKGRRARRTRERGRLPRLGGDRRLGSRDRARTPAKQPGHRQLVRGDRLPFDGAPSLTQSEPTDRCG
jgi:menaquinone-dependent protoporphyrinogen oxidase